jgi:hypothetical protein
LAIEVGPLRVTEVWGGFRFAKNVPPEMSKFNTQSWKEYAYDIIPRTTLMAVPSGRWCSSFSDGQDKSRTDYDEIKPGSKCSPRMRCQKPNLVWKYYWA